MYYSSRIRGQTVPLRIYRTYLSPLSHKRLGEKNEDHHGEAVRQVQRHGYYKIWPPPSGNPFAMGLPGTHTKDFILLLKPAQKKIN